MTIDLTKTAVFLRRMLRRRTAQLPEEGAILGESDRGTLVTWPPPSNTRASHGLVMAGSGAGKTILCQATALSEIQSSREEPEDRRLAVVVIDPKGDLADGLLQGIAAECPEALRDVRYLDPFAVLGGYPFNLGKLRRKGLPPDVWAVILASLVGLISTSVGDQKHLGTGQRQQDVLQHLILAVCECEHPAANLLWTLEALVTGKAGTARLASLTTSPRAKQFLLSTELGDELRTSCAARLRSAFALTEGLARMTAAPSCLDLDDALAPGRIVLAHFGRAPGGFQPLTAFQSNAFTRIVVDHLYERTTPWRGHHVRLWLDEAQILAPVLNDVAERVLTTGRSFGLSAVIASQGTALLKAAGGETLLRVLTTNAPLKIVGRLAAPDAELLAREQAPGPGIDSSISDVRSRFIGSVTNLKDRDFLRVLPGETTRFRSKDVDLDAWRTNAEAHGDELDCLRAALALSADQGPPISLASAVPVAPQPPTPAGKRGQRRRGRAESDRDQEPEPTTPKPRSKWG